MYYSNILGLLLVISTYACGMEKEEPQENKPNQPNEYRINLGKWFLVIRERTKSEKRNNVTDSKTGERQPLLSDETKKASYDK